mgnify:CR=1 FL=1
MATVYLEEPKNWSTIESKVITEREKIIDALLYKYNKVFFYDTCSFRGHSNMLPSDVDYIIKHIKSEDGVVVITRCILMELASRSGELNQQYIELIDRMVDVYNLEVIVMNEEDLFYILSECFSTAESINTYLMWAVRMLGVPTSTVEITLAEDTDLKKKLKDGKGLNSKSIFADFFKTVRNNKTQSDNLGEELLAICLHILSYIPGENDYKYNVITEDKGARAVINNLFAKTQKQFMGRKIVIYSTPRLTKTMVEFNRINDVDSISRILGMGRICDIKIFGTLPDEFETTEHTFNTVDLAKILIIPDGIDIRF